MRICVFIVATLASGSPLLAVDSAVLDMTQQPTSVGWTTFLAGGGNAAVAGGLLTINSPINGFAGYQSPASLWPAAAANPAGWRIEARVNITSRMINSPSSGCLMLIASDGAYRHFLEIYPDHIALTQFAYTGTFSAPVIAEGQFHTYVFSGLGPSVTVTIDGNPALSAALGGTNTTLNHFQFGDLLFANESHSDWSYVAFGALPAPGAATLALIGLGGMMTIRSRRR